MMPLCCGCWWHHQVIVFLPSKSSISIKIKASYSLKWKSSECLSCGRRPADCVQVSAMMMMMMKHPPPVWTHSFLARLLINYRDDVFASSGTSTWESWTGRCRLFLCFHCDLCCCRCVHADKSWRSLSTRTNISDSRFVSGEVSSA